MGLYRNPEPGVIANMDLETAKRLKKEEIAARRWEEETGGTVLHGIPIATDDRSQLKITGAALQANIDPAYVCQWKTDAGFVDLNAPMIMAIATGVREFVQACYDKEAELNALVGNAEAIEEVRAIHWNMGLPDGASNQTEVN